MTRRHVLRLVIPLMLFHSSPACPVTLVFTHTSVWPPTSQVSLVLPFPCHFTGFGLSCLYPHVPTLPPASVDIMIPSTYMSVLLGEIFLFNLVVMLGRCLDIPLPLVVRLLAQCLHMNIQKGGKRCGMRVKVSVDV
jgi:hypothetical protein